MLKKIIFLGVVVLSLVFGNAIKTQAAECKLFGKPLTYTGYLRQEGGVSIVKKDHINSAYSSLWFESSYHLSDVLQFHLISNPSYDNAYDINRNRGWWENAKPYYYPAGAIKNSANGDPYNYRHGYDFSKEKMALYNDYLLREFYVDVNLGKLVFRLGRQTVGWGESDGIRVMDFINPLDLSREFVLRDPGFEETRRPLWMLKTSYYPEWKMGKLKVPGFEFLAIPDIKTTRVGMRTDGPARGLLKNGIWGMPQPILPSFITEVPIDQKERDNWDDTEFAARVFGEIDDWLITLNFFYGWSDDFVVKPTGIGALANIPGAGLTEVGRYSPQQVAGLGLNDAQVDFLEKNGTAGTPFAGVDQLRAYFDGVYKRQKIIGITANREVSFLKFKNTSPVFRFEGLYQFDKAFNNDGDHWGELAWLKPDAIVEKDQIKYMLGLDWPLRIPALNSRETFFTSLQFIQYIIPDYDEKLFHAPYYYGSVNKTTNVTRRDPYKIQQFQNFCTVLVNTAYDNGRFVPSVLYAQDFQSNSYFVLPKINLKYNMHFRQEIGAHIYGGNNRFHGFGMYDNNDQIYFRLIYQF